MADTENKSEKSADADSDHGSKEQEIYQQRLDKAAKWRDAGFNPYGNGYRPEHQAEEIHAKHGSQSTEELEKTPSTSTPWPAASWPCAPSARPPSSSCGTARARSRST